MNGESRKRRVVRSVLVDTATGWIASSFGLLYDVPVTVALL